jgi:uncharacterized protein YraI
MRLKLVAFLLLLIYAPTVLAQEDCAPMITAAIQSTMNACANIVRGQACYGSAPTEARARMGAAELVFGQPGDMADTNLMRRLTVSADATGLLGVATMRVQANLPDNPVEESVTMVAFGDVQITNVGTEALSPTVITATATAGVNIRALPTEDSAILDSLVDGETVEIIGRLSDSSWVQVSLPDGLQSTGWVFASILRMGGDENTLMVIDPNIPQYTPMQAFRFQSNVLNTGCAAAPQSGILIQTPKDAGRVLLSINNVNVRIGSTAFVQAISGGALTFHVLEGSALIDAQGGSAFIPAGARAIVQLNTDGLAAGAPIGPFPYDESAIVNLPITLLPTQISIAPSLTQEQIDILSAGLELPPAQPPAGSQWTNSAGLVSDTCGGAAMGATFPVTLVFDANNSLVNLAWNDLVFTMSSLDTRYVGTTVSGDALYSLDLTLTSATTYSAELVVTFEFAPSCAWRFHWDGSST